jgi:hypothetical protein
MPASDPSDGAVRAALVLGRGLLRQRSSGHPIPRNTAAEEFYRQVLGLLFRLAFLSLAQKRGRPGGVPAGLDPIEGSGWLGDADVQACVAAVAAPDDLDAIYQRLLEYHPMLDAGTGSFDLVAAAGHRRKTGGSYYTPAALVDCLLDSALEPILEEALAWPDPEAALLRMRICDPACGSGRFLVAAGRRLAARLASGSWRKPPVDVAQQTGGLRPPLALECLYGADSDPLAVLLCKMSLWLESAEPGRAMTFLDEHIRCGDSLADETFLPDTFDVVLTNPPWERLKVQEKEWFAARCPAVAAATNAAARKRLIRSLKEEQPALFAEYREAVRRAAAASRRLRKSGRFPLSARGDLNAYGPFVELSRALLREGGRAGLVVPSGLATDDTMKDLFQDLLRRGHLVSWYDFHNRGRLFPGVQGNVKFGLLTLSTSWPCDHFTTAAQLATPAELGEPGRLIRLSAAAVERLNPNTLHCPTFASASDAALVGRLHDRFPVLVRERPLVNPWGLRLRTPLHMTNEAARFRTARSLRRGGWTLIEGNVFCRGAAPGEGLYLPLYEAKLVQPFNHRAATFAGVGESIRYRTHARARPLSVEELADTRSVVLPRYWVPESLVQAHQGAAAWFLCFRNAISAVADSRSLVAAVVPRAGVGNSLLLIEGLDGRGACLLLALLNSFILDYVLRQKASGGNLNFHVLRQLPVPAPEAFAAKCPWSPSPSETLADWVVARVLELTYTTLDLADLARACGHGGPPFAWDEERRRSLRCELDAACFHVYGLDRAEVEHVLRTFTIAERQEVRRHGRSLRREAILACYDRMTPP